MLWFSLSLAKLLARHNLKTKQELHTVPQMAFLEVVIPPDIIYEETSGDMMVPEGGSAKLVCKARGFPRPKVVWRREDGADIIVRGTGKTKTTSAPEHQGQGISMSAVVLIIFPN